MMNYNRYYIKRVALHQDDNGKPALKNTMQDVKKAIDTAVAEGAAWLIITTHFNEWDGQTWDTTVDSNGYPVGYSRFNEIVQYALNAGLTPVTFAEGWTQYKAILDANEMFVNQSNY